ncbi:phosphopantetheine-binding protein [Saccharothrix syringae]|uniref:Acyl carrier protein n=1 Tax=Saccharothrix syringae TaxID=103733 RepID=A0A5Q0H1Z0_SACSY|nr:phosphopantetheine-binding protein [Saccharothrix syringae]QFZ20149.1 acyl carrier protein [Saccharothrix syringae]
MTIDQTAGATAVTGDGVREVLLDHLEARIKVRVAADHDLLATGLVTSMFAMELIVYLEQSFGVEVVGDDLRMDNFRSVDSMTGLVLRLRGA